MLSATTPIAGVRAERAVTARSRSLRSCWASLAAIALACSGDPSLVADHSSRDAFQSWPLPEPRAAGADSSADALLEHDFATLVVQLDAVDVAYDGERRLLYVASKFGTVIQYDLEQRMKLREWSLRGDTLSGLDLSPDRSTLLVAAAELGAPYLHRIHVDLEGSDKLEFSAGAFAASTYSVAFVDDERALVSTAGEGLYMLRLSDGHSEAQAVTGAQILLVHSADRSVIAYAKTGTGAFGYYDIAANRFVEGQLAGPRPTEWIAASPDGAEYALVAGGILSIFDRNFTEHRSPITDQGLVFAAAYVHEANATLVAWSSGGISRIDVFDASFSKRVATLDPEFERLVPDAMGYGGRIEISDDGRYLFAFTQNQVVAYSIGP
jgi:hypothetical protein